MSSDAVAMMTFEQFLAGEVEGDVRHEYVGGQVFLMSGGSERHSLTAAYLMQLIGPEARSRGCRTHGSDRLLRPSTDVGYYPDLMVVCGKAAHELYETDAVLIVEVLSQSTRVIDRREKLEAYRRLPSLQSYALVEPTIRKIDLATLSGPEKRVSWEVYGSGSLVNLRYVLLEVDAFYDVIDSDATA